jgi:hypothetical protein
METSAISVLDAGDLSRTEIQTAMDYLTRTRDAIVRATARLTPRQATFRPEPHRWSIADVVEHLMVLEEQFLEKVVVRLLGTPANFPDDDCERADARVVRLERDPASSVVEWGRVSLADAPPALAPRGRWTLDQSLARFRASRARTVAFLESTADLRQHVVDQPALGPLDGYQWILFVAAHTERHTRQIGDLIAHPRFPRVTSIDA